MKASASAARFERTDFTPPRDTGEIRAATDAGTTVRIVACFENTSGPIRPVPKILDKREGLDEADSAKGENLASYENGNDINPHFSLHVATRKLDGFWLIKG